VTRSHGPLAWLLAADSLPGWAVWVGGDAPPWPFRLPSRRGEGIAPGSRHQPRETLSCLGHPRQQRGGGEHRGLIPQRERYHKTEGTG